MDFRNSHPQPSSLNLAPKRLMYILHNYKLVLTSFWDNSRNLMNLLMESNGTSCEYNGALLNSLTKNKLNYVNSLSKAPFNSQTISLNS